MRGNIATGRGAGATRMGHTRSSKTIIEDHSKLYVQRNVGNF